MPQKGGNAHRALPVDKLLLLQGLYCLRDLLAVYLPLASANLIGASKGPSISPLLVLTSFIAVLSNIFLLLYSMMVSDNPDVEDGCNLKDEEFEQKR